MDFTPQPSSMNISDDSGCLTGSFSNSRFESTPTHPETTYTPTSSFKPSRKRKISHCDRKLANISEIYPSPQFSSTFNDSLSAHLEKCTLTPNFYVERADFDDIQQVESHKKQKSCSAPATPMKQVKTDEANYYRPVPVTVESPYKEAIDILYPEKPKISGKKTSTPQKFSKRIFSPAKKRLFSINSPAVRVDPIRRFQGESLILSKIFALLSDSDLCRARTVSSLWCKAIDNDADASRRHRKYIEVTYKNKENQTYTPPDSPPSSPESPPVSPKSQNFHQYTKIATKLSSDQSLRPCLACGRPSIVQKNIAQCQNPNCEYICCLLCDSFSKTGPQDFHDRCQRSQLMLERSRNGSRFGLSDLSNSFADMSSEIPSFFSSDNTYSKNETSGFVSDTDSPITRVRRNLNSSFGEKSSVLADHNRNVSVSVKKKRRSSLVPVVSNDVKESVEIVEPSSPPKVKNVPFSKQSKKNLKRLLF